MIDKKIQILMPSAIQTLIRNKREMPLKDFERVYGPSMVEALAEQGHVEVKVVRYVDEARKVPARHIKMITLIKS